MTARTGRFRNDRTIRAMLLIAASLVLFESASIAAPAEDAESSAVRDILLLSAGLSPMGGADVFGDVDYSGTVEASDAALLLRYETGHISTLPLPSGIAATPTLKDAREAAGRMLASFRYIDFSKMIAALPQGATGTYAAMAENHAAFARMAEAALSGGEDALADCMPVLSADFRRMSLALHAPAAPESPLGWKDVAALYSVFGEETADMIRRAAKLGWANYQGGSVGLTLTFGSLYETAAGGTAEEQVRVRLAAAYLDTVYDDVGNERPHERSSFDADYLATVAHPLPGCTIKNCWYDPRDRHTRYHMGTDILAKRRTKILSATDGRVLFIGYLPVPGNYVVVRDPFGYEYHYYHMFERSKLVQVGDMVKQGDAIGLVGNTGNSAANHLHLSIVAPDGRYVNPYDLYLAAGIGPIRAER